MAALFGWTATAITASAMIAVILYNALGGERRL